MASRKGIIITAAILATITAASFLIWNIPQKNDPIFVISDYKSELDRVKEIHQSLKSGIEEKFNDMNNGEITPDDYIQIADVSTSQINAQIIELVESKASEEWQQSYIDYIDALKGFNSYVRETMVVANMKKDGAGQEALQDALEKANSFKRESESLVEMSDKARP